MGSGREGRNQVRALDVSTYPMFVASMGSGREGRNQVRPPKASQGALMPQWGPAARAGIRDRKCNSRNSRFASMGSGREGRNQPTGFAQGGGGVPASMGSGREGRNQAHWPLSRC